MNRLNFVFLALVISMPSFGFQASIPAYNDSARYYLERGNTKTARTWIERALKENTQGEFIPVTYAISGAIKEEDGYLSEALKDYETGYEMAVQKHVTIAKAACLNGRASILNAIGKYDSVLSYLEQSRMLDPSKTNLVINLQVEGRYWQTQNQYDKALEKLQLAHDYAAELKDQRNLAIILSSIGSIYFSHNPDMSNALGFYERSNAQCDSSTHANILARNYGRIANAYMVTGDLPKAEESLRKALKIVNVTGNLPVRAYILSSWATYYGEVGKFEDAIEMTEEPIRIRRELGQTRPLQNDLLNVAEMYMMVKKFSKAKLALQEGLQISRSLHDIVYMKYFYDRQSMLDSLTGNYQGAYSNLKLSMAYKDSTFSAQQLRDVREIQEKYESEQNKKIIAEKELQIEQQKYQAALITGAFVIAILILIVATIVIRGKSKQKLAREREQQHHLRLQTIVQTQEEVQQRIARDLHDGLVQVLGAAKMSLQSAGPESDKSTLKERMVNASEIIDEAVAEARTISHELLPYALIKGGLVTAFEELFSRSLASYSFVHDEQMPPVSEIRSVNIYRIVQELVNNFQKHSGATSASISLRVSERKLHLIFADNGRGSNSSVPMTGAGLSNMSTRAELLGGSVVTRSIVGKGTSTELIVPL
jgi:two-component system NarL family sensor kinase